MLKFNKNKIYNAYLVLTNDYDKTINNILDFAIDLSFDKNLVISNNHPDIITIDNTKDSVSVESIRENVIQNAYLKPILSDRKFYIIYDANMLNSQSQNVLLKTIEEPALFDTFFFVTKNDMSILDTIKSRCVKLLDLDNNIFLSNITDLYYFDDAIKIISNLKYETLSDISSFINNVVDENNSISNIIHIFIYFLKDILYYKRTFDDCYISLKNKMTEIVNCQSFSYRFIGDFLDKLYSLIPYLNKNENNYLFDYNILNEKDKSFMLYNILINKKREL